MSLHYMRLISNDIYMYKHHDYIIVISAFLIPVLASIILLSALQLFTDHRRLAMASGHKGSINAEALGMTGERHYNR